MLYFLIDNLVYGGAERQAKYLLENSKRFKKLFLLEDYKDYNLKTNIPIKSFHPKILKKYQRLVGDNFSKRQLSKIVTNEDTIISYLERSNLINIKTSLKTGHKSIISVRNYLSERYKSNIYIYRRLLIKKYYPMADKIVTNSIDAKKDLVNNFAIPKEKIQVIYNAIDVKNINILKKEPIEKKYEDIFKSPVIINVGSLTPQKNQKELIEAFKIIKSKNPEYKLVIIGKGNLYSVLRDKINELGLQKDVFLLGKQENPFKFLYRSDMFVLNSEFEGFPNVLLESLAVGTPVVARNCLSGPAEMLGELNYKNDKIKLTKYGYIFPRKNKLINQRKENMFLIEAIEKLIALKNNNYSKYEQLMFNSMNRSEEFEKNKIINQWENIG